MPLSPYLFLCGVAILGVSIALHSRERRFVNPLLISVFAALFIATNVLLFFINPKAQLIVVFSIMVNLALGFNPTPAMSTYTLISAWLIIASTYTAAYSATRILHQRRRS